MKIKEKKWIRFRIYLVALFFVSGMGVIWARAYQLQILERDRLSSIARSDYEGTIKLPPKRGIIYDRDGNELAVSVEVESIYAHPKLVQKKLYAARHLSKILNKPEEEILRALKSKKSFVWIARKVPPEVAERTKTLGSEGIGFTRESRRYYPGREIAGHLIGFAGDDNQGLEGLEKAYDEVLKGPGATLVRMRDALGRPFFISMSDHDAGKMGNLVLTIDRDIQYQAQKALAEVVRRTGARAGHSLVVNPRTGEILAMAIIPQFNPNEFRGLHPSRWRNRIVTDTYEPGSVIKVFLLATALEENIVSPDTLFDCENGAYKVAGHIIHDTKEHGLLNVEDIIVYSSNIGAVKIGQRVGYEKFYEYLKRFGFGERTGIDLIGEREGFIREPSEAKEIDKITLFFGQGMTATSIQLAMAVGALANGGSLMRPYVVKAIRDQRGNVVKEIGPKIRRKVLGRETSQKVVRILEGVVSKRGTAAQAAISGYRVAGKTGTPQKVDPASRRYSKEKYMAIFVGFVPANRPKLLILVVVDEPRGVHYGGVIAGPVFRRIGSWSLNHLRINPEIRLVGGEEPGLARVRRQILTPVKRAAREEHGVVPDFRGKNMRDVLKKGRALGLKVIVEGTGFAYKQDPYPGRPVEKTEVVKVSFRPPG